MKYKVGDKIRIREDLYAGLDCYSSVIDDMLQYAGKSATVTKVFTGDNYIAYRLDIDSDNYSWNIEMFELNETNEMKNEEIKLKKSGLIKAYNAGCDDVKAVIHNLTEGEIEEWVKEGDGVTLVKCRNKAKDGLKRIVNIHCDMDSLLEKQLELQKDLLAVAYVLNDGWEADWNRERRKYFIFYNTTANFLSVESAALCPGFDVHFKSTELTERAIELVGGVDRWREAFGIHESK